MSMLDDCSDLCAIAFGSCVEGPTNPDISQTDLELVADVGSALGP